MKNRFSGSNITALTTMIFCWFVFLNSMPAQAWFFRRTATASEQEPERSRPSISERVRAILADREQPELQEQKPPSEMEHSTEPLPSVKTGSATTEPEPELVPLLKTGSATTELEPELVPLLKTGSAISVAAEALPELPKAEAEKPRIIELTLGDTVVLALSHNLNLLSALMNPDSRLWAEEMARASFDPNFSATLRRSSSRSEPSSGVNSSSTGVSGSIGVSRRYQTGMSLSLTGSASNTENHGATKVSRENRGMSLSATLPLVQGRNEEVNTINIRQAELDSEIAWLNLEATVTELLTNMENAYWDYALAVRNLEIQEKAMELARQEYEEVKERIRLGRLAENELVAAEANVAAREVQVIDARSRVEKRRLSLIRQLDPERSGIGWNDRLIAMDNPAEDSLDREPNELSLDMRLRMAMENRSDYKRAELSLKSGELGVIQTEDGLLPDLDLVLRLDGSAWKNTPAVGTATDGRERDITVSLNYSFASGQRAARARLARSEISRDQAALSLRNMSLIIQEDVRAADYDVRLARQRVRAAEANSDLRSRTYETEREKFYLGRSTAFLVSQTAHALVGARIAEQEALVALRKALLQRHRVQGTLLHSRGIYVGPEFDGIAVYTGFPDAAGRTGAVDGEAGQAGRTGAVDDMAGQAGRTGAVDDAAGSLHTGEFSNQLSESQGF